MAKKRDCFVITPFGKKETGGQIVDFDAIFEAYIKPSALAAGFNARRADTEPQAGMILPRMFEDIYLAEMVIADVSYYNPNVYYELGVRHALRRHGTVLIRRKGGDIGAKSKGFLGSRQAIAIPFDIQGIATNNYTLTKSSLSNEIAKLADLIRNASVNTRTDSPAFLYLPTLRVSTGSPPAKGRQDRTYEVLDEDNKPTGRFVGYRSGDLKNLDGDNAVDFWVNSENVLMQMARIYEQSVSSTIRYLGAVQPHVSSPDFDDTIANDLTRQRGNRFAVDKGEVLVTTSGKLQHTHGVRAILHAATVTCAPGKGWAPIEPNLLEDTVATIIERTRGLIRSGKPEHKGKSVIMPLFGTGQARGNPDIVAGPLISAAIQCLSHGNRGADEEDLKLVLFSAFTEDDVKRMQRLFEAIVQDGRLRRVPRVAVS